MKNKFLLLPVLALLLALQSCAHLEKLDLAQRNFSYGATVENNARFTQQPTAVSPSGYYRVAYVSVVDALKKEGKLEEDGLLGNAIALKALCEWKLGQYQAANASAKEALLHLGNSSSGKKLNRDQAVMSAMDALITIEQMNEMIFDSLQTGSAISLATSQRFFSNQLWDAAAGKKAKLENAIQQINEILFKVPPRHEVRNYLIMSQLSGMKTWNDALDLLNKSVGKSNGALRDALNDYFDEQEALYLEKGEAILSKLSANLPEKENSSVYKYWKFLLLE